MKVVWYALQSGPSYIDSARSRWLTNTLRAASAELSLSTPELSVLGDPGADGHALSAFLRTQGEQEIVVLEDGPSAAISLRMCRLLRAPAIFFDLNFTRATFGHYRHSTGGTDLNAEMKREFGETAVPIGDYHVRRWPTEVFERFFPLGNDTAEVAPLRFVFQRSQLRALANRAELPVVLLPLPVQLLDEGSVLDERRAIRSMLEISTSDFVIGYAGSSDSLDKPHELLDAVNSLNVTAGKRVSLLWIAPDEQAAASARALVQGRAFVRIIEAQSEAEFATFHAACDLCAYLRSDPLRGFPMGFLCSAERGIPVLVSSVGFGEDWLDGSALAIRPDGSFVNVLIEFIRRAASDETFLAGVAANFQRSLSSLSPERTATAVAQALQQHSRSIERVRKGWSAELSAAKSTILAETIEQSGAAELGLPRAGVREVLDSLGWSTSALRLVHE